MSSDRAKCREASNTNLNYITMYGYNAQTTINELSTQSEDWKDRCSDAYDLILSLQREIQNNGNKIPNDLDLKCDKFFDSYNDNCM